jgi:tetratricopeptide (TPR) repeat protein
MMFADSNRTNLDTTGVLFKIEIDPSISTTPYTSLDDASEFLDEQEILFSMHTIFRIDEMTEIEDHLWEVNLILTNNNDEQLKRLTDCIKLEIGGVDGWFSMGILLHKMGKLDKALDVYTTLLEKKFDGNPDLQPLLRQLTETNISEVHRSMGNYSDALKYLEPKEKTSQDTHSSHHLVLLKSYDGIAGVHLSRGNYSTALSYYEKALDIAKNTLPADHDYLTTIYSHMALAYQSMGDYSIAGSYCEKVHNIQEK